MKFEDLDCRQTSVVDSITNSNERLLVLGGPGTGKTTTALWAARTYLEQSHDIPLPRVLFLTFSRSAVAQIVSRSPGVLNGIEDRVEILTFHALSYRLLRAFGKYSGLGQVLPEIESEARARLRGRDKSRLNYDDLLERAVEILTKSSRVRALMSARWGLVICDEAQDTGTVQWQLLQLVATRKVLLLGDVNQMIYGFLPGVTTEGFDRIRRWSDREIQLLPRSHRDPTGAIPAMADAVRVRDFQNEAVMDAIKAGRLTIHFDVGEPQTGEYLREENKACARLGIARCRCFCPFECCRIRDRRGAERAANRPCTYRNT